MADRQAGQKKKCKCMVRYLLAALGSIGMGIIYGLKVCLHIAIVSMVNHTAVEKNGHAVRKGACFESNPNDTSSKQDDGPFAWSHSVQGILLGAYFFGYLVSQIPGARIAEVFSAKWVMFFAVAINVVCTILTPIFSELHYAALMALRILEGIGGGVTFPAMHVLIANWSPPNERSVMSGVIYAGTSLGTVIFMLLSGLIAGLTSWIWIFYILGGASAIWLVLWIFLISDSPEKHKFISEEERTFIKSSLASESITHGGKVPWKAVFTSMPFLAILIAHVCSNFGWYMVLIELPTYMKTMLNFKISENAVLASLPFFIMWLFALILSKILDTLRAHKKLSTTWARKIATLIASVIPATCFVLLCFVPCEKVLAVVLLTVATTSIGGMFCGFLSNHIDIAPNFAGTLVAITNTAATIPGIVVPIFVGELTDNGDLELDKAWMYIFLMTIGFYIIEILVYTIFASGEVQKWNSGEETAETRALNQ